MKSFIVTGNPPTPNGDLHVGHLSGPYLGADIFTRYQRMRGNKVAYLCFSDDHQSFVVSTAMRKGCDPAELIKQSTERIKMSLRTAAIEVDLYENAIGNQRHISFVQGFFKELYDKGIITRRASQIPYCTECRRYLFESYIHGLCPYCNEESVGNLCEACGRINDPVELLEPQCGACGSRPAVREYEGFFFPFENYRNALAEFYSTRTSWRPHQSTLCQWLVSKPIPAYPVSYPTDWGIPVPVPGFSGQTINAWFEMYPAHVNLIRLWSELQDDHDLLDQLQTGSATLVQFCGYDNTSCNAILHAALDQATGGRYLTPSHVMTNEFYLLEGEKFSTSRNHAIWAGDLLGRVSVDALRYYLSRTNPEYMQTSFSEKSFDRTVAQDLKEVWAGTIDGFLRCVREDHNGRIPTGFEIDLRALGLVRWAKGWLERFYDLDEFSPRHAGNVLTDYVIACADYLNRFVLPKRGTLQSDRVASMAHLIKGLACFALPLMPGFSQQLWAVLGADKMNQTPAWADIDDVITHSLPLRPAPEWFTLPSQVSANIPVRQNNASIMSASQG